MDYYHAVNERSAAGAQVGALELRRDHGVLRELIGRHESTDDRRMRRELIRLVTDLFEVHCAIEAQGRSRAPGLSRERQTLRAMLARFETAGVRDAIHPALGVELSRTLEVVLANEESLADASAPWSFRRDPDNHRLLSERARLLDYAEQLLRTH